MYIAQCFYVAIQTGGLLAVCVPVRIEKWGEEHE